ncbi:MAG: FtsQ-type POTRA domain-containing protein [Thermodesulfobacteriota bacterium]
MSDTKKISKNISRKETQEKRRKAWKLVLFGYRSVLGLAATLIGSLMLIFIHDLMTQGDFFPTNRIMVSGASQVRVPEILECAQVAEKKNILSFNLSLIRKRLLGHPWIAEADVKRELPDGLAITIREHEPLAVIDLGKLFLINTSGEIFKEWKASDPGNLPMICGLDFSSISVPGTSPGISYDAVITVLLHSRRDQNLSLAPLIKQVIADPETGISLCVFEDKKTIRLGYQNYPEKLERFKEVLFSPTHMEQFDDFDFIDLIEVDRMVVAPVHMEQGSGKNKEV